MNLALTSTAFQEGEKIPREYTADGQDLSPPLKWTEPPGGTKALAVVCVDPDAPQGTFTHWVAFNLPAESRELSAGIPAEPTLQNGTVQGVNDMGRMGYSGPAPPKGKPHHYYFKLLALDQPLKLPSGITDDQLWGATAGHVLAEAQLMGTYGR